jgi:hypothetical protein
MSGPLVSKHIVTGSVWHSKDVHLMMSRKLKERRSQGFHNPLQEHVPSDLRPLTGAHLPKSPPPPNSVMGWGPLGAFQIQTIVVVETWHNWTHPTPWGVPMDSQSTDSVSEIVRTSHRGNIYNADGLWIGGWKVISKSIIVFLHVMQVSTILIWYVFQKMSFKLAVYLHRNQLKKAGR